MNRFFVAVFVLFLTVLLSHLPAAAQQRVQFIARVVVTDGSIVDTVKLGVNGDGAGTNLDNTIGLDDNPALDIFFEAAAPPLPPATNLDARFLTIPGRVATYPTGLGSTGSYKDFRDFRNSSQIDTFRVKIEGDRLATNTITVSWNTAALSQFGTTWTVKSIGGGPAVPATNMLTNSSVAITSDGFTTIYNLLIIKVGAFTDPALPIQLASFTANAGGEGGVVLRWTTLSETNNYGFEVESSSSREGQWQLVPGSFVPGHGTTVERHEYAFVVGGASAEGKWYRLKQIDLGGNAMYSEPATAGPLSGVGRNEMPFQYGLDQNYPNPFNPSTEIRYSLRESGIVRLALFNVLGQEVVRLVDGFQTAGQHTLKVNASSLASGIYFYRLDAGKFSNVKKMTLLK